MNYDEMTTKELNAAVCIALGWSDHTRRTGYWKDPHGTSYMEPHDYCTQDRYSHWHELFVEIQQRGYDLITWYARDECKWCAAVAVSYFGQTVEFRHGAIEVANARYLSKADTLPLAVCRTVLKALEVK